MRGPRRTLDELEPSWLAAYELYRDGWSVTQIATALSGPPHHCGSYSTAKRWVENGQATVAAKGDPLRKRQARREMAVAALDALRVKMAADAAAGDLEREAMYRLTIAAIEKAARIGGWEAPRPTARVNVTSNGGKPASLDPALLGALSAVPVDELLDALHTLPDERTEP